MPASPGTPHTLTASGGGLPGQRQGSSRGRVLAVGALLAVEGLLIAVPAIVLGQAVNWPQGLGEPAGVTLPMVAENEAGVRVGYVAYLLYSLLFLPAIAALVTVCTTTEGRLRPVARVAVILAALSALARAIGILRWLTAMPTLAAEWDGADPAMRQILAVQFQALNDFGGGIGELLGVALLGGAAVACTTIAIREFAPAWLTWLGAIATAAAAIPLAELAGVDAGALTSVGVGAVQLWFLAGAVVLFRRAGKQLR
ncbi:DUF4386 family protein [Sinosporangium siamense]|uniref:DUF4386 domain-containing protein n=1 Tax=Sinosporangium siamense TaxID=1367973 RepID=A0A919RQP0_9ACTN|nr:DUF4386 family protein [Sinosporangium siamense]GII96474.1 hypothetical protein Ssi02_67050 [Sinosporangium siamense]